MEAEAYYHLHTVSTEGRVERFLQIAGISFQLALSPSLGGRSVLRSRLFSMALLAGGPDGIPSLLGCFEPGIAFRLLGAPPPQHYN
jgi:hypothetical protein